MATLTLVRHGQASFLADDYDRLSSVGELQSSLLGRHWARRKVAFDSVFCGPRARQSRTAEVAAEAVRAVGGAFPEWVVLDELDEMRADEVLKRALPELCRRDARIRDLVASFEAARARPEAARHFQSLFATVAAMWVRGEIVETGIEPWAEFITRVRSGLARMREGGGRVLAFTSGGPVSAAVQFALGTGDLATLELMWAVRNASVTEFLFSGDRFSLSTFNSIGHLDDPALSTYR